MSVVGQTRSVTIDDVMERLERLHGRACDVYDQAIAISDKIRPTDRGEPEPADKPEPRGFIMLAIAQIDTIEKRLVRILDVLNDVTSDLSCSVPPRAEMGKTTKSPV